MGQVILEVPQNVNLVFRIDSETQATEILAQLKRSKFELAVARGEIELPTARFGEDSEEVLGIWADRPESGMEIARRIRDLNNGKNVTVKVVTGAQASRLPTARMRRNGLR